MKYLMRFVKSIVGLFPKQVRKNMRQNLWLYRLYSKSLQKSGLFYGFPTPEKLQKLYVKNIVWQSKEIAKKLENFTLAMNLNCLIILSGNTENDLLTLRNISSLSGVKNLFFIGEKEILDRFLEAESKLNTMKLCAFESISVPDLNTPLLIIRGGDILHLSALEMFAHTLRKRDEECILYCDTDYIDKNKDRSLAEFFPDWNPDLQLTTGYIKTGVMLNGHEQLEEFLLFAKTHLTSSLLALWMVNIYLKGVKTKIEHIPFCLVHQSTNNKQNWQHEIEKLDVKSFKITKGSPRELATLNWDLKTSPLVSLIVPTKNAKSLVENCINSILEKTRYENYEIILIDNNSDEPLSLDYFAHLNKFEPKVSVISYPHDFNYSAINNFAVKYAKGEIIGLINNDIEVISENWLENMVGHVLRHDIGCVGAKLLFPDTRIQHAGVVMGYGGGAGHAHKYFPRYHPGYLNRLIASHNYSAVTAACLLVTKSDYNEVGGLNETDLTVAFNDVDFCLRVLQLGRRNLYCAEATLFHHESVSRGQDDTHDKRARFEKELEYLQSAWSVYIHDDPAYNPNLTLKHENFSIKG